MIGLVEVVLAVLIGLTWAWIHVNHNVIQSAMKNKADDFTQDLAVLENNLVGKFREALDEFEDLADEVVPDNPDPFEAMEIMRANMINQVLGMGVNWIANKFTKVEMGVHQLENVDKPPSPEGEAWHDVEHVQSKEAAELTGAST
jgi:hypothetical protein